MMKATHSLVSIINRMDTAFDMVLLLEVIMTLPKMVSSTLMLSRRMVRETVINDLPLLSVLWN